MPLPNSQIVHPRLMQEVRGVESAGMPDTCTIANPLGTGTTNPLSGAWTPDVDGIYDGPCRVQPEKRFARDVDRGEADITISRFYASLPHDAPVIPLGAVLTVTVSIDSDLVGEDFVIRDVGVDTFQSRRLLTMERRPKPVPT